MFGQTVDELILYLAPITQSMLSNFNYDATALGNLLDEKAQIVLSKLPNKYLSLYQKRTYRMIAERFAFDGQVESKTKTLTTVSSIVGYKTPGDCIDDLKTADIIAVSYDSGEKKWTYPALEKGDFVVVDFENDMSSVSVKPLAWATKSLAAIDLLRILTGERSSGELFPRIEHEKEMVSSFLMKLNPIDGNRVIINDLEFPFWNGKDSVFSSMNTKAVSQDSGFFS